MQACGGCVVSQHIADIQLTYSQCVVEVRIQVGIQQSVRKLKSITLRQESNTNLGFLPPGKRQLSKGDNLSLEMNLLHPSKQGCGDGDPTHQQ